MVAKHFFGGLMAGLCAGTFFCYGQQAWSAPVVRPSFDDLRNSEDEVRLLSALSSDFKAVVKAMPALKETLRSLNLTIGQSAPEADNLAEKLRKLLPRVSDDVPAPATPVFLTNATCDPRGICTKANDAGTWSWRLSGDNLGDTLVVIGGEPDAASASLIDAGYVVWKAKRVCDGTGKSPFSCRESFGYIEYLADADAEKPTAKQVAFIRGDPAAWVAQRQPLLTLLKEASRCVRLSLRYRPLQPTMYLPGLWKYHFWWAPFADQWNKHFGDRVRNEGTTNTAWSGGQFVVPSDLTGDRAMWQSAREKQLSAFFWEYNWHVAFGEDTVSDVFRLPQECVPAANDQLGDAEYAQLVRTSLRGTVVIDRYMQEIRTANSGADVLVVFGLPLKPEGVARGTSPKLVAALQAKGYNVWLLHPESVRSTLSVDLPTLGYLTFLRREGRVATQREVVFLRGDEDVSVLKDVEEGLRCAGEHKQYVALGRSTEAEAAAAKHKLFEELSDRGTHVPPSDRENMAFVHTLREFNAHVRPVEAASTDDFRRKKEWPPIHTGASPVIARVGSHFVVPQSLIEKIPSAFFSCIADECNNERAITPVLIEHLWHWLFGAPAALPSPYSSDLCQPYVPRAYLSQL